MKKRLIEKTEDCFISTVLLQQKNLTSMLSPIILVSSLIYSSILQNQHLSIAQIQKLHPFHLLFTPAQFFWLATPQ